MPTHMPTEVQRLQCPRSFAPMRHAHRIVYRGDAVGGVVPGEQRFGPRPQLERRAFAQRSVVQGAQQLIGQRRRVAAAGV